MPIENLIERALYASGNSGETLLRLVVELGIHAISAEEGSLLLLDGPTKELVFAMTAGDLMSESALKGQRVPVGEGVTGLAASTRKVQVGVPASRAVRHPEHYAGRAPSFLIAAPMLADDELVGVLTAARYAADKPFADEDQRLFARIAELAGAVVPRACR